VRAHHSRMGKARHVEGDAVAHRPALLMATG
jgi:hypothetical protein